MSHNVMTQQKKKLAFQNKKKIKRNFSSEKKK